MAHPASYTDHSLPDIKFSHHPPTSPTVTPVVLVILNRPNAHNAFTDAMTESLVQAFTLLSSDPRVKAIVLTGSDPSNRIFCAGMDLNSPGSSSSNLETHRDGGGRVSLAIYRCTKPVVAALNGSAVGVGITMTLPANIRIASTRSKIGFVFGRRGFNMEATSSFFLPRLIGASRALHLVTTGAVYPATHPLLSDLFSEVVEPENVLPRAIETAEEIAANVSGVAVRVMKDLVFRGGDSPEAAHLLESRLFYELFRGKDAKEGMASFMQKRPPRFEATVENDSPSSYPWWDEVDVSSKGGKSKI